MAKKQPTKKPYKAAKATKLANRAKEIIRNLEWTYVLGKEALAESRLNPILKSEDESKTKAPVTKPKGSVERRRRPYARHVITDLAEEKGVHFNTVETARRIAECYDEKSFRHLIRRKTQEGLPLTSNHLTHLSSIVDSRQRSKFEDLALSKGWSVRKLAAAIKEERIKKGRGKRSIGNKPVIPTTLPGVVRQIIDYCDKWKRWSSTFSAEVGVRNKLQPQLKGIQRQLAFLDSQVDAIHKMAGALLAPRKAKSSHKSSRTRGNGRPKAKSKGSGPTRKS